MVKQKTIYIYRIYFPTSRKCYIGQTMYLNRRLNGHLKSKYLVGRALRKYDNYKLSILHKTKSQKKANKLEIAEIAAYNSIAPNGYNLAAGGEGLFNPSEETRKKMSESSKGKKASAETRKKIGKAGKGRKHTKKARKKMSKANNRSEVVVKKCLTRKGIKYTKVAAIKWLRIQLKSYKNGWCSIHVPIRCRKLRIAKYEKWLKELQAS